jgi:photosystem II stability/assembly factor-like uncharacterized protein
MKKLIMVLTLGVIMISCSDIPTEVANPKQETTVELQQLASIDSSVYKVIEKNNTVYIFSTKDNTIVNKVRNDSGLVKTLILVMVVLIIGFFWFSLLYGD